MPRKKLDPVAADDIARRLLALGYRPEKRNEALTDEQSVAKTVRTWIMRGWPSGRAGSVKPPELLGRVSTGRGGEGTAVFDFPDVLRWCRETGKVATED